MVPSDEAAGAVLDRYRIIRRIAIGGMGDIFLARQEGAAGFARPVVIKQIRTELVTDESSIRMFEREARINARIRHPHIVSVLDFREVDGAYLMVMEYVPGMALSSWLRFTRRLHRPLPVAHACVITESVLDALAAVHRLVGPDGEPTPVIHRDVSPSNVLLDLDGRVKLTDFGIARLEVPDGGEYETQTYTIKGKVQYLAPELLDGSPPSVSSDLYAAGVVLHEMLVGENEFKTGEVAASLTKVLTHRLSDPADRRSDVSRELGAVVVRATSKEPESRFTSADVFRRTLQKLRGQTLEEAMSSVQRAIHADLHHPEMEDLLGETHPTFLDQTWRHVPEIGPTDPELDMDAQIQSAMESLMEQTARVQAEVPPPEVQDDGATAPLPDSGERPQLELATDAPGLELAYDPTDRRPLAPVPSRSIGRWLALMLAVGVAGWLGSGFVDWGQLWPPSSPSEAPTSTRESRAIIVPAEGPPPGGPSSKGRRRRIVAHKKPQLRSCLREAGVRAPTLKLSFRTLPDGSVDKLLIRPPEVAVGPAGPCLDAVLQRLSFPRSTSTERFSVLLHGLDAND